MGPALPAAHVPLTLTREGTRGCSLNSAATASGLDLFGNRKSPVMESGLAGLLQVPNDLHASCVWGVRHLCETPRLCVRARNPPL